MLQKSVRQRSEHRRTARCPRERLGRALKICGVGLLVCAAPLGCAKPFKSVKHLVLTAPVPADHLTIEGTVGDVTITAEEGAVEVRAEVTKIARATSPERAEEALDDIRVTLTTEESAEKRIVGRTEHPAIAANLSYAVRWRVTAPPHLSVEVRNSVGDVRVMGFRRQVDVTGSVGDVVVECDPAWSATTGPVTIRTEVGSIVARHISKGLTATGGVGGIRASAGGEVDLATSVGEISLKVLSGSRGGVRARTSVGDIGIRLPPGWKGKLLADTDLGSTVVGLGSVTMTNVRHRRHHFSAEIGESSKPIIDASADIGDVTVKVYQP